MGKAKPKSEGMFKDAHPTAPGGMSKKALAKELAERHGYGSDQIVGLSWPQLIDAVIAERRAEEQEAEDLADTVVDALNGATSSTDMAEELRKVAEFNATYSGGPGKIADHLPDESSPYNTADDSDPDELMAELAQAKAEAAANALFIGMPGVRDFIFDGHAGAGPSGAERWMNCTESLGMARKFLETLTPNQQEQFAHGGEAASQGTTAHAAGEAELLHVLGHINEAEKDATLLELAIMPTTDNEAYDEDMAEHVAMYVDLVSSYVEDRGPEYVHVEARVEAAIPLTATLPDGEDVYVISGSSDSIVMPTKAEPDLVVIDYKHGEGIDVEVDANPQVRIYALGALDLLTDDEGNLIADVQTVTYHIVQPRMGGIKSWSEPLDNLLDWRDEVLSPALTAALTGEGAVFAPSESTCQWCPAKGICSALAEQRVSEAADLFDTIVAAEFADGPGSFPETTTLDNARLGSLLSQIEGLVKIRDDLREEAQRRLHRGEEVPGYKLVGYTPPRKWTETAAEALDDDDRLWVRKLLTPKQAAVLLKKQYGEDDPEQIIGDHTDDPVQKPVIARVDDRRHEWKGAPPEQMFTNMDEE